MRLHPQSKQAVSLRFGCRLSTTQVRCALGCGTQKIWRFSQPDVVLITKAGLASSGQPTKDVLHRVAFSGRFGLDRSRCALLLHPASKPVGFLGFGLVRP